METAGNTNKKLKKKKKKKKKKKEFANQEWKTAKMVMMVIGLFFLLWLPYFSVMAIKSYHPKLLSPWVERWSVVCAYLNSCANFVVYSIMNKNLRSAFKELLPCFNEGVIQKVTRTLSATVKMPVRVQKDKDGSIIRNMELCGREEEKKGEGTNTSKYGTTTTTTAISELQNHGGVHHKNKEDDVAKAEESTL